MADVKKLLERARELAGLREHADRGPWRACVWDPLERPHITTPIGPGQPCTLDKDVPWTKENVRLFAASWEMAELLEEMAEELDKASSVLEFYQEFWCWSRPEERNRFTAGFHGVGSGDG